MELPIFPLNGAVLFPGTSLPLNIFEGRYIDMVNYALARDRFIGMIQTDNNNNLYNIGCVGKIHSFNETTDDRYLISLQGTHCFKVLREIEKDLSFRILKIKILERKETSKLTDKNKIEILEIYKRYVKIKKINLDIDEIQQIEIDQIIKFIAMVSPFKNIEKQALLETRSLEEFYEKLKSIIELEIIGNVDSYILN